MIIIRSDGKDSGQVNHIPRETDTEEIEISYRHRTIGGSGRDTNINLAELVHL